MLQEAEQAAEPANPFDRSFCDVIPEDPHCDGQPAEGEIDLSDLAVIYNGPSLEDMQRAAEERLVPALVDLGETFEQIGNITERIDREFNEEVERLGREKDQQWLNETAGLRSEAENQVEDIIQGVVGYIETEFLQQNSTEAVVLAKAASQEESHSVATGVAAGFVGVVAGMVAFNLCNKKEAARVEQPLL